MKVEWSGGNEILGVTGEDEVDELDHVDDEEGSDSVGEDGESTSESYEMIGSESVLMTRLIGSSSVTCRSNPNSADKSHINVRYLSRGSA